MVVPAAPAAPPAVPHPGGGLAALAAAIGGGPAAPPPASTTPAPLGGVVTGDVRTLSVVYDATGERFRDFGESIQHLETVVWPDTPVKGPATVLWVLKFMKTYGGTPTGWHQRWMTATRLQPTDAGVSLHESFSRMLELMICFDQLSVGALASAEFAVRQIQMVEEKWKEKILGAVPESMQESHLFSGTPTRGTICVCPDLQEYVSKELAKASSILKERRKAREERTLAKPPKG